MLNCEYFAVRSRAAQITFLESFYQILHVVVIQIHLLIFVAGKFRNRSKHRHHDYLASLDREAMRGFLFLERPVDEKQIRPRHSHELMLLWHRPVSISTFDHASFSTLV